MINDFERCVPLFWGTLCLPACWQAKTWSPHTWPTCWSSSPWNAWPAQSSLGLSSWVSTFEVLCSLARCYLTMGFKIQPNKKLVFLPNSCKVCGVPFGPCLVWEKRVTDQCDCGFLSPNRRPRQPQGVLAFKVGEAQGKGLALSFFAACLATSLTFLESGIQHSSGPAAASLLKLPHCRYTTSGPIAMWPKQVWRTCCL